MYEGFIFRVFLAAFFTVIASGVLGCFVVWRGMAYFSDAMSHSTLIGIVIALAVGIEPTIGIFITCTIFAVLFIYIQKMQNLQVNAILGIISYSAVAIGLVLIGVLGMHGLSIEPYLFGDLLSVSNSDVVLIAVFAVIAIIVFVYIWEDFLLMTIDENLAIAEGVNANKVNLLFTFALAFVVAVSIRTVGILFISAMLILLPSSARLVSRSPSWMVFASLLIGLFSVAFGMLSSITFDVPFGASIIGVSSLIFYFLVIARKLQSLT